MSNKTVRRPKGTHLSRSGAPKVEYRTEDEALAAIPIAAPHQRMWEPMAYPCAEGDHWHIGNASPLHGRWPLRNLGDTVRLARPSDQPQEDEK